jgi:hypothetical protein
MDENIAKPEIVLGWNVQFVKLCFQQEKQK